MTEDQYDEDGLVVRAKPKMEGTLSVQLGKVGWEALAEGFAYFGAKGHRVSISDVARYLLVQGMRRVREQMHADAAADAVAKASQGRANGGGEKKTPKKKGGGG